MQNQLRQQVNPRSDQMVSRHTNEFVKGYTPQKDYGHGISTKADGRVNPSLPTSAPGQNIGD